MWEINYLSLGGKSITGKQYERNKLVGDVAQEPSNLLFIYFKAKARIKERILWAVEEEQQMKETALLVYVQIFSREV